jgi:threonine dehydrogenase-like Zn-dependent dehydrogenase
VIGAGAVGLLSTLLLRLEGIDVWTASLEPSNELVEASGAHYVPTPGTPLSELGRFDLVVEAAGNAQLMADSLGLLRRSGVACLLGIDPRKQTVEIDGPTLALDTILENRVLFGSVNAHRQDWLAAVDALDRARERWPDALEAFVGLRVPLDRFAEAFAYRGGKATLVLEE